MIILLFGAAAIPINVRSDELLRDIRFILGTRAEEPTVLSGERPRTRGASEIELFASGAIRFYQVFISSQDAPSCNFTPSCSNFSMHAFQQAGALKGLLLGTDRLMRCHYFSSPQLLLDCGHAGKPHRICDPVEIYTCDE